MAARTIGTATISFGLVSIPVRLFSAANPKSAISFRLLSKEGHRLKQQYIDPKNDDQVVPRDQMVKGYEFAKDQYVVFTPEELKEMDAASTQAIEIAEFIPEDQVSTVFHAKTYYLGAGKGGDKPYALLCRAMEETGRCALAKYAARGKEYLVMIAPMEGGLVMHQLHYADEIARFDDAEKSKVEIGEGELALAIQLIEQIAKDSFEPDKFEDEVRQRVEAAIQQKIDGHAVTVAAPVSPKAQIIDLMEALKASLGADASEKKKPKRASAGKKTSKKKVRKSSQ